MSERTKKLLSKVGIIVQYRTKGGGVNKKRVAYLYESNNLLEYYGIVRPYICKKFGLSARALEVICFLYPKGYFTRKDYYDFPFNNPNNSFEKMIRTKWIERFVGTSETIYQLTPNSRLAVRTMHRYLLDPTKLPEAAFEKKSFGKSGVKLKNLIDNLKTLRPV